MEISRNKSNDLYQHALKLFPGGVNSPVRAFRSVGGTPLFIEKGKGAHLWDADGNRFIDYCCSWGPLILGHAHPAVNQRIMSAVENGTSFGAPTRWENELAELIISNHPAIDKIRFVSSGTEAVMSAVRLARGFTGRSKILKFEGCYHGHVDSLLVKAGSGLVTFGNSSSAGVPEAFVNETIVVPLHNRQAVLAAFEQYRNQIACIIIEPIPANNGLLLQDGEFLRFLKDIAHRDGALLIFDEVISGFRVGFTGASGHYDIMPDLLTFGKIIGGGLPVGAYGGRKDIMSRISPEGDVYQAGTLSGNPVAMNAGIAQLTECLRPGFYERLRDLTHRLVQGVVHIINKEQYPVKMFSVGSIFWIAFSKEDSIHSADQIDPSGMKYFSVLHRELLNRGVYLGPSGYEVGFVSDAHTTEDIDHTVKAFGEALQIAFSSDSKQ